MTTYLYGQAPGKRNDPGSDGSLAFRSGRNSRRLAQLAGVSEREFHERVVCLNVLSEYPGPRGKGDAFPMEEARRCATRETARWECGDRVIFAGQAVARAFGFAGDWFEWRDFGADNELTEVDVRAAMIPHPSGVSRFWNDAENVRMVERFMRGIV